MMKWLSTIKEIIDAASAEIEALSNKLATATTLYNNEVSENIANDIEINDLRKNLNNEFNLVTKLNDEKDGLQRDLDIAGAELDTKIAACNVLRNANEIISADHTNLREKHDLLVVDYNTLKDKYHAAQNLIEENESLSQVSALTAENGILISDYEVLEADHKELRSQYSQLGIDYQELVAHNSDCTT